MRIQNSAKFLPTMALSALLAVVATPTIAADMVDTSSMDAAPRFVHQPNLGEVITPYLNAQGFMDREFPPTVAYASPYLTDFYGILALQDGSIEQLVKDFVPQHASLVSQTENSVTLAFHDGFSGEFFPYSNIELVGHGLSISHAKISGVTWQQNQANIQKLMALFEANSLSERYLLPNAAFESEKLVAANQHQTPKAVLVDANLSAYDASDDAVLLFSEKVHGKDDDAIAVQAIMDEHPTDWLGLEMLNTDMQPTLDSYNRGKAGETEFEKARAALVDYFESNWNGRAGPATSGEENYYFELVEYAHSKGVDVVALEHSSLEFLFFRYGETDFGASVRSLWWAQHLPQTGKGIVFGGGAHYNRDGAINVQDFIAQANPQRLVVGVTDVTKSWH